MLGGKGRSLLVGCGVCTVWGVYDVGCVGYVQCLVLYSVGCAQCGVCTVCGVAETEPSPGQLT